MNLKSSLIVLLITAAITVAGNFIVTGYASPLEALPGMLILVMVAFTGVVLAKIVPLNIPAVLYVVTLAVILTVPGVPGAEQLSAWTAKVNFLALTTPILAYAGIYSGKNLDTLKRTGWRIVLVAFFVMFGTYTGSAVIAQVILQMTGQIQ